MPDIPTLVTFGTVAAATVAGVTAVIAVRMAGGRTERERDIDATLRLQVEEILGADLNFNFGGVELSLQRDAEGADSRRLTAGGQFTGVGGRSPFSTAAMLRLASALSLPISTSTSCSISLRSVPS